MKNKIKYFIVDFETTGVDPIKDYPIEIGGLFCDENWNIVNTINQLIKWYPLITQDSWKEYWKASTIHKISWEEYRRDAIHPEIVVEELIQKIGSDKPIIVSDCLNFEWEFMRKLLEKVGKNITDIFHYCGRDTNLLFELAGIEEESLPHRASPDACITYKQIVQAITKIKGGDKK